MCGHSGRSPRTPLDMSCVWGGWPAPGARLRPAGALPNSPRKAAAQTAGPSRRACGYLPRDSGHRPCRTGVDVVLGLGARDCVAAGLGGMVMAGRSGPFRDRAWDA